MSQVNGQGKEKALTGRGNLTPAIQKIAIAFMGREMSQTELRLLAYVDFMMKNEQRIDPRKINEEERMCLKEWRKLKWIEGGASGLSITREFYDFICKVLWEGYVIGGSC